MGNLFAKEIAVRILRASANFLRYDKGESETAADLVRGGINPTPQDGSKLNMVIGFFVWKGIA